MTRFVLLVAGADCSEKKVLVWWLVCSEGKVLVADKPDELDVCAYLVITKKVMHKTR
jgi:hypothetical protein